MKASNNFRRSFLKNTVLGAAFAATPSIIKAENVATIALQTKLTKEYGLSVPIISAGMAMLTWP